MTGEKKLIPYRRIKHEKKMFWGGQGGASRTVIRHNLSRQVFN
jgi:hypothetical protein